MTPSRAFAAVVSDRLTGEHWDDLLKGRTGILRVPDFMPADRRRAALKRLDNGGHFAIYDPMDECGGLDPEAHRQINLDLRAGRGPEDPPPVSRRLGRTLYEHAVRGTAREYFDCATEFDAARRDTFSDGGDVIDDVLATISSVTNTAASIADEPGHGLCYAGVIRDVHGRSRLHTDDAREETPGFTFSDTPHQLSLYVFLDMPQQGGDVTVYEREYRPEDTPLRLGYGLAPHAVAGDSFVGIAPRAGDLMLFPARNIHRVDACSGPGRRIMMQAHLGIHANGEVVCWS